MSVSPKFLSKAQAKYLKGKGLCQFPGVAAWLHAGRDAEQGQGFLLEG